LLASIGCCAAWAVVLFGRDGMEWWTTRQIPVASYQTPAAESDSTRSNPSAGATISTRGRVIGEVLAPETVSV